jgi:hypothetical protein
MRETMRSSPVTARFLSCILFAACALAVEKSSAQQEAAPHTLLIDGTFLLQLRQQGDAAVLREVRREADHALKNEPVSVMDKSQTPPSGDKHDYMSLAPYFWPNPDTKNHLPYVRHDGLHNPEASAVKDHEHLFQMSADTHALALAYFFTRDEIYAKRASLLLHVWFLNSATRMNPHLKYAQAILGVNEGRGIGILDARGFADVVDALAMLQGSPNWTAADETGIHDWFEAYFLWLTTNPNGKAEAAEKNNHGSWYDVQVEAIALYLGKTQFAKDLAEAAKTKRIATQIQPDGQQPLEQARTKSFGYCVFNLDALTKLAELARRVDVDLWHYKSPQGASIRVALDYLLPYATGQKKWTGENIIGMDPASLRNPLLAAAIPYHDAAFENAAAKLSTKEGQIDALLRQREFSATQKTAAQNTGASAK